MHLTQESHYCLSLFIGQKISIKVQFFLIIFHLGRLISCTQYKGFIMYLVCMFFSLCVCWFNCVGMQNDEKQQNFRLTGAMNSIEKFSLSSFFYEKLSSHRGDRCSKKSHWKSCANTDKKACFCIDPDKGSDIVFTLQFALSCYSRVPSACDYISWF